MPPDDNLRHELGLQQGDHSLRRHTWLCAWHGANPAGSASIAGEVSAMPFRFCGDGSAKASDSSSS